jgi:hypothetical protein
MGSSPYRWATRIDALGLECGSKPGGALAKDVPRYRQHIVFGLDGITEPWTVLVVEQLLGGVAGVVKR